MNQYQAGLSQSLFFPQPSSGLIRITGPDCIEFIQRQSTQDARQLERGRGLLSVLTSPTARIFDVLYLLKDSLAEKSILLVTLAGRSAQTFPYLQSRIFFNDKVALQDLSHEVSQLDLFGPQSDQVLKALHLAAPQDEDGWEESAYSEESIRILKMNQSISLGYRLLVPSSRAADLSQALSGLGAIQADPEVYQIFRVERGLPAAQTEFVEEFTPLEVGLHGAISHQKGCYTGQEVIARQVNYDKITRHLVGLKMDTLSPEGASISAEGRPVGRITSSAVSPSLGPLALAVVRRPYHEVGSHVSVDDSGQEIPAQVHPLPFTA
jgi:tRNA-modifying protein YgfZ